MAHTNPIGSLLYAYRVFAKWLSFFVFGLAALLLVTLVIPVTIVFIHPRERFQSVIRHLVSAWFRCFIRMMKGIRIVELRTEDRETFRNMKSKIVVANHPSLLDVVMLISLIPNADVIVRGSLAENPIVSGVVRCLYILNTLDFERLASACGASLAAGNCLVIFPEGTRTPRNGEIKLKKGAARISLLSGAEIVVAHIGGTDKYGLGKRDPFIAVNPSGKYVYDVSIRSVLNPQVYAGMETPRAVRRLNDEISSLLREAEDR
jgi:1-acyl-sn-glycerol-3-phosphate acyltransferase